MRRIVACLLLGSAVTLVGEEEPRFIFPPFAGEDMKTPAPPLPDEPSDKELNSITVEEWRWIMATAGNTERWTAVKELVKRGDQKTILRLVYSLKQGNPEAVRLLNCFQPMAAVPFLMEDVAHGSLEYFGVDKYGFDADKVRIAAAGCVASILAKTPSDFAATGEFNAETRECLEAIRAGYGGAIQTLSDQSRYLIEWWLLNESVLEAGKKEDARPLPKEITYLDVHDDKIFANIPRLDNPLALLSPAQLENLEIVFETPEKQPPKLTPEWELAEPFEAWAERIVDPKRRNLDFVALSWDGKKVVEHPARSLDPEAKPQHRESRKTSAPRNPPERESGNGIVGGKGILWMTVAAILMAVFFMARWIRRKPVAG